MNHLTDAEVRDFREELERQLRRLLRSMEVTDEAARPVELDQTAVGRLSRMDSLQNQHLTRNLKEREQVKLARIEKALRRMEAGSYGLCAECGAEIATGRLMAFPETDRCAACGRG